MPKHRRSSKSTPQYTLLSITIENYEARCTAGINLDLLGPAQYIENEDEFTYRFDTTLEISGVCIDPEERSGEQYDITIYTADPESWQLQSRIRDLREQDEQGITKCKKLKSGEYPIYREPPSIGFLDKVRGENRYTMAIWLGPLMITDTLILLSRKKQTYISIHEKKFDRKRRIKTFTIQTLDPANE
ncbi:MAG: hypothetical protein KZQ96_21085 [Candidatus Thiodiazotropha sp. (ex Lucinoma borealis)]|nr:hypothetical protein [Candidatus Thiodiazotropha sp. (ex Lucinoma borealis)]